MQKGSILFLVPFPLHQAPSQRFRMEIYEPYLRREGISYSIVPFMDISTSQKLYKSGGNLNKAWGTLKGYLRRLKVILIDIHRYEFVFITRQAAPLGPPIFEFIISKIWRKKMIFDFDDALWIPRTSIENKFAEWLKCSWKIKYICKWSYKVTAGNQFLFDYASKYNNKVLLLPTTVDLDRQHNMIKTHHFGKVVVGWTGSHSTLCFLEPIISLINQLQKELDFTLLVICNKRPDFDLKDWQYIEWSEEREIEDLLKMDIGIMPLTQDKWSLGKCGFKIIQYLSLGIPAIASPVGVNNVIIEDGKNSFLCSSKEDWRNSLSTLIHNHELRKKMGEEGKKKIIAEYNTSVIVPTFIQLFS